MVTPNREVAVGPEDTSLRAQAAHIAAEVKDLGVHAKDLAKEKLTEAGARTRERVGDTYDTAKERAGEVYDTTKEKVVEFSSDVACFVGKHPFRSIMIAAGAGTILGMLLRRR